MWKMTPKGALREVVRLTCIAQQALVPRKVSPDGAHHDHGYNAAHHQDDHQGVQYAEPMHLHKAGPGIRPHRETVLAIMANLAI